MKKLFSLFLTLLTITSSLASQEINLGKITTYIDTPLVEQRQIFDRELIDEMNVGDLPTLLTAAGVQLLSYGPYGLEQKPSIRGFTDETVRVVIDGVCVNNAQYGTFDFSTINIDDIESVEIVRGGFTEGVSDEGSVGGVIYITTKLQSLGQNFFSDSSIKSYINLNYPVDTVSQSLGYNGQIGDSSFFKASAKGTFANNKYLFNNYYNKLDQRENAEVLDGNGLVNFQHYYGNGNSISLNDLFYGGNKNTPGSGSAKVGGNQKDYDNNLAVQHTIPDAGNKRIKIKNSVNWLSNTRFYTEGTSESEHYVNTVKYAGTADFYGIKQLKESVGLTFDYTYLDSTNDGIHSQFSGTLKSTTKYTNGIFSLSLPLAAKFCNKNFAFTPKLGAGINTTYVNVFIDGYRMTQFPNMDDLYWEGAGFHGNPDLIPENGWGGDFTVDVHNLWFPFSICVFSNYYENKIQWAGNTPQNVASAFYFGIDYNFEKQFWENRIFIRGSGEYLYTKLLDESKKTYGNKIMWTPDFVGSFAAGLNLPAGQNGTIFNLVIDGNYVGKRYISNMNITFLEPYFLLNLSSEVQIPEGRWKITPYFRLENILNTSYEAIPDYPMPGFSGTLGCKINFSSGF